MLQFMYNLVDMRQNQVNNRKVNITLIFTFAAVTAVINKLNLLANNNYFSFPTYF